MAKAEKKVAVGRGAAASKPAARSGAELVALRLAARAAKDQLRKLKAEVKLARKAAKVARKKLRAAERGSAPKVGKVAAKAGRPAAAAAPKRKAKAKPTRKSKSKPKPKPHPKPAAKRVKRIAKGKATVTAAPAPKRSAPRRVIRKRAPKVLQPIAPSQPDGVTPVGETFEESATVGMNPDT